ncbi:hypothetical protein EX30DRAFT_328435 [Ascodesmis nigricans]|uniref:tRNA-splicing endonuclease subunit Sen2 n=1 Tax=Ascodesmis nigricans TaxID=341454 RepID=A0A4S2N0N6_9PEZI|nr:hypothetical protein EX30DRAFT_328435 [Ascodesmis nigricans]
MSTPAVRPPRRRPDYNTIHAKPLPVSITPYPPLIPHNPLSLLQILYTFFFCRQSCLPSPLYTAKFSEMTRCVHVTDERSMMALWNDGFFGKGSLSRSEPTWLSRRRRELGIIGKDEALTAEEITERRRKERKDFKLERARAEKERIQKQLEEERKATGSTETAASTPTPSVQEKEEGEKDVPVSEHVEVAKASVQPPQPKTELVDVENLEHLQLTPEEAFFLAFGLGCLQVLDGTNKPISSTALFTLFRRWSHFPPLPDHMPLQPDDTFILSYVIYHHFRSLGWVVRPGVKFGVDYLLYNRGPVFSHAEFGIVILPSYSHPSWSAVDESRKKAARKPWHWLHCVNRVSAQVKKTIILVYVDVPPPEEVEKGLPVKELLKKYRVREFSLRRFVVSRNRD